MRLDKEAMRSVVRQFLFVEEMKYHIPHDNLEKEFEDKNEIEILHYGDFDCQNILYRRDSVLLQEIYFPNSMLIKIQKRPNKLCLEQLCHENLAELSPAHHTIFYNCSESI